MCHLNFLAILISIICADQCLVLFQDEICYIAKNFDPKKICSVSYFVLIQILHHIAVLFWVYTRLLHFIFIVITTSLKLEQTLINPRPAGGGRLNAPPPSGFSRIAKKRRRAAPPGFHPPYLPSFPQLLWKFRPKAMWGQVTRSGQVTQLQNNFPIAPRLQCFRESYETFGIWWGHQCLQNVYLGFLISVTSGQVIFATSPL